MLVGIFIMHIYIYTYKYTGQFYINQSFCSSGTGELDGIRMMVQGEQLTKKKPEDGSSGGLHHSN